MPRTVLTWSVALCFYILAVGMFSYVSVDGPPVADNIGVINAGRLSASELVTPEGLPAEGWSYAQLPDKQWIKNRGTSFWYQFNIDGVLDLCDSERLAFYFLGLSERAEFFINGVWIGENKSASFPTYRGRGKISFLELDKKFFSSRGNNLYVRLPGEENSLVYLNELYVGNVDTLFEYYGKNQFVRNDLVIFIVVLLVSFGFFVGFLWFFRKQETYYLWFSIASFLWAIHDAYNFGFARVFSPLVWDVLAPLSFGWAVVFIVLFLCEIEVLGNSIVRNSIVAVACFLTLPFLYLNLEWVWFYAYGIWFAFVGVIGVYAIGFLWSCYNERGDKNIIFMLLTGVSIVFFGVHDLLVKVQVLKVSSPFLLHFSAWLSVVVIVWILLQRFLDGMQKIENYNQELQQEVRLKEQAIERNFSKIQKLQRTKILSQERERVMRDLHDGIGGSLVAVLASLDTEDIKVNDLKREMQYMLQDLRLVIDSMDNNNANIAEALGMLRERLENQLRHAEFELKWKVVDLPELEGFGPEKALYTMRTVQEAISNAIKHSQAEILMVSTYLFSLNGVEHAVVEVKDDGHGMIPNYPRGRGIVNMHKRAKKIGAVLQIENKEGRGVTVRLAFPLSI